MTISICNWVKSELSNEQAAWVSRIDTPVQCQRLPLLGYQTKLFEQDREESRATLGARTLLTLARRGTRIGSRWRPPAFPACAAELLSEE